MVFCLLSPVSESYLSMESARVFIFLREAMDTKEHNNCVPSPQDGSMVDP